MLRQALILSSNRKHAQAMREALLKVGDAKTRVDVELDAMRAMQLVPQQYELILIDVLLDSMDGLQLLMLMRQQSPSSKFVVVGDAGDEISRGQAYRNGADFFIERPHSPETLSLAATAVDGLLKQNPAANAPWDEKEASLVKLADIVQTRCLSGDSVLLLVRGKKQSGDIFISRGEVFHAQYPGKSGADAFRDMMRWDNGQVQIKEQRLNHVPPRTIEVPYRELIEMKEVPKDHETKTLVHTGELREVKPPAKPEVPSVMLEAPPLQVAAPAAPVLAAATSLAAVAVAPVPAAATPPAAAAVAPVPTAAAAPVPAAAPAAIAASLLPDRVVEGGTSMPVVNAHWKIDLAGTLVEGSQLAEMTRCSFITYFFYRKLADVAVALEVDYFNQLILFGPHLQQVLVADNMGIRHAVFDTAWTSEEARDQYVKWCCEQSI